MKNKILKWLFSDYAKELQEKNKKALELQIEAYKATLDVKDLIRSRLKSVRPTHPDEDTILRNHLASLDTEERLAFLGKAKEVTNNEAFKKVVLSLLVELQMKAGLESQDMVDVNFNRAGVNGVMLIEEELQGLTSMYIKEHNDMAKMTDDERLSAL